MQADHVLWAKLEDHHENVNHQNLISALHWADPLSKEPYLLSVKYTV
jgi:hypothetical protein